MNRPTRGIAAIPLFSYGFRPFFLAAGLWAALAMVLWIGAVSGAWTIASAYGPVAWHAHEFLFGYVSAAMTGFLLTAIPNWTGRLPVSGGPLMALLLLWVAGRVAMLFSDGIGPVAAAAIDALFLVALAATVVREIVAGRNWRNLKTVGLVSALALANIGFHAETDPRRRSRLCAARRHRAGHRPHHADRRPRRAELHPQLAGAAAGKAPAGSLRGDRLAPDGSGGAGARRLGGCAGKSGDRGAAARRRRGPGLPPGALGRERDLAAAAGLRAPRGLSPSYRSASSSPASRRCGRTCCRRPSRCTAGRSARSR